MVARYIRMIKEDKTTSPSLRPTSVVVCTMWSGVYKGEDVKGMMMFSLPICLYKFKTPIKLVDFVTDNKLTGEGAGPSLCTLDEKCFRKALPSEPTQFTQI